MANNIKAKDVVKGVFSAYAPTTINTVDSAREVASDVRTIGRRINTGMRQNMAQIDKSQPGRRAIALFAAAKDALTSGDYEIEQANDNMYDDYEEYEANFTTANMTDDERANTSPEEVILRGNKGVAQSVIRASTAQLSGMNAASRKILSGTLKGMEASTKSINATIMYGTNVMTTQLGMVNNKLDTINKNLVTLIEYQNDNTTTYYEKNLELMSTMLKSMENLNAMSQGKGARDLKNFSTRGGFNVKEYLKRVKKGIKNSAMVSGAGMLGSIYKMSMDNPDIMSPGETIGQMVSMVLGSNNKIGGKLNTVAKFDKRIQQYMDEALYQVGDKLGSNLIASLFGLDSLGNKRRKIGGVGLSNYMKDSLPWNGKAQKALTEVIPELLTSIDAGVNKTDKRYFDYEEGNWKNRKEIAADFASQVSNNITLEMQNLTDMIAKKLEASGKSADEIASAKKQLSDRVTDRIYGEGDLKTLRTDTAEILKNMNLSNEQAASVFNSLEAAISNVTESISEMYARIGSTDSIYRNINNRSGASASETIGKEAYRELRRNRNETNIFDLTFSQDVDSAIKLVERQLKEQYPEFRMTKEYQDAILAAVRSGASNASIVRSISNAYGRSAAGKQVFGKVKKFVYGAIGKEYKPEEIKIQEDEFDNFGTRGNAINYELMKKVYGVDFSTPKAQPQRRSRSRTVQPQQNKVGAASSRGSNDAGKVAGAGTNAVTQGKAEGKSSTIPVDTQRDKARDELVDAAMGDFNDAMNATESNLQQDEAARANGAKMVEDIAKEGSNSFGGALKNLVDTAVTSMAGMFSSFTSFGARLFGKEGLISNFFKSDAFKSGMKSIKEKLFNEKDGVFKDQVKALKDWGADMWGKTKEQLAKGYDWVYDKYSTYKYGEDYQNNEKWQNSSFMQTLNLKARREAKAAKNLEEMKKNNESTSITLEDGRVVTFDGRNWRDADGKYIRKSVIEEAKANAKQSAGKSSVEPIEKETLTTANGETIVFDGKRWRTKKGAFVSKSVVEEAKYKKDTGATATGKSAVPEIQKAAEETKSSVQKVSKETPKVLKESTEKIAEAGTEAAKDLKESTEKMTDTLVGDTKEKPEVTKKKYAKSFNDTIKKHLPKIGAGAIVGAGLGMLNGFGGASLLGSMFLPTGIIGGAIVGGGLTLLSQTEAFRSLMFGPKGEDGERSGGLISKELKEKFKKAAPIAVGGAVAGALKSIIMGPITGGSGLGILGMQLLPGGILGGAIMGMGVGLLKNSETFKSMLFGKKDENGKRTGTWLSKSYESMKEKMAGSSEGLKKALKGGAIGAVSGTVLAHMGAIPAALSMGGPIGAGIVGLGLGIASSTKRFNEIMFGVEEFDDNGKSLGRKGGVLGRVKNLININVVEPISQTFRSAMLDMIDWTKDKITLPFRAAFGPILDSIKGIKDNVVEFVSDKFNAIGEGITSMLKKTMSALFSPITKLIGGIGKAMIGGAKVGIKAAALPLTGGLSVMNFLTSGKRMKEYGKFYKDYYTQGGMMKNLKEYWAAQQEDYDEEAAATGKRAKHVGLLDKASDFLSAITGQGEIADHARKGYNESMTAGNQNSLGWRSVFQERKKLKSDRRERLKAERQWKDIGKLSRSIGNRDLGGREVTLSDSRFEKYKKKFTKLGIDASLINTNDDLMELIYHPEKFRARAAGDTGRNGMLQALKEFRLSPEEVKAMEETSKYQTHTTEVLDKIEAHFRELGENELFDRATTSYKEDRARDTKLLKRKLKKVSKNTLWEGRKAINFNDPELQEYDIEGLSEDDLNDYAASNYADNNDFKGWLASIGRKMSPNDNRMQFIHAKRAFGYGPWTRKSVGKDSVEEAPVKSDVSNSATIDSQKEIAEDIKKQRELAEAQMAITTGGQTNAKKVMNKASSGTLDAKSASKFSIGGIFSNIFNRKAKADKKAARDAKEAAESAEAQALGDEKEETDGTQDVNVTVENQPEEKKSLLSKILGGFGSVLGGIGGFLGKSGIAKAVLKFGAFAIPTVFGLTALELFKPGSADAIGAKLDAFNQSVDDGTFVENVKTKVTGILDWITGKVESFFNDTKVGNAMKTVGAKIAEQAPVLFTTILDKLPTTLGNVAEFIADNAEIITTTATNVITTIAPPLLEAMIKSLPKLAWELGIKMPLNIGKSLMKSMIGSVLTALGFKNPFEKDEDLEEQSNLSKTEAEDSNKHYQVDKSAPKEYLTQEEADKIESNGGTIRKDSNGLYEEKYVVPTSNVVGFDDEGNAVYQNDTGLRNSLIKTGIQAGAGLAAGGTKLTGALAKSGKLVKPAQFIMSGAGKITSFMGKALSKTAGKVPIIGLPSKITGGVINAEGKMLQIAAHPIQSIMGTADNPSVISKAATTVKDFGAKVANSSVGKKATEVISKITGKSAGIADDAAKAAADTSTTLFAKVSKLLNGIKTNETLLKILDKFKSVIGKECKPLEWICKFLDNIVKAISSKCTGKLATKITTKLSEALTKAGATSVPVITVVMGAYGVASGAMEAENLFHVDEADGFMVAISAIMKGLLSISIGCIFDILFELASMVLDKDIKQEIAMGLYKLFTAAAPQKYEEMLNSQEVQETERAVYNTLNDLNLDEDAYNDLDNKTVIGKLGSGIKNSWYRITGQKDKVSNGTKDTEAVVKALTNAGYSQTEIASMSKSKIQSTYKELTGKSVGNGAGIVGYGPGPNSQANSAWADMPIGRFSNGKTSTMKTGGCGPTALSTIANMFGNGAINPGTVGMYAARNGFITDGGANEDLFTKGAAGLGLNSTKVYGPGFNEALKSGMPMAISGKNSGPFTKAGHVVVARGMDKNGNINVIDPMDGNYKKYSKSDITSGMTNAWAYGKPIGYGLVDSAKTLISSGLSDSARTMIANNLGLVQNAISNIPQIMQSGMEAAFKIAAKAIATPVAVPIEYAVKALGTIGKIILNDENLTTEEVQSSQNTSNILTKMSSSLRKVYSKSSMKTSTSKVSTSALKETTTKTSKNNNILTRLWNKVTGKSKKVGNGYGAIGYGMNDIPRNASNYSQYLSGTGGLATGVPIITNQMGVSRNTTTTKKSASTTKSTGASLALPSTGFTLGDQKLAAEVQKINNNQAGPVSYEYIYDTNYRYLKSMGMSDADAAKAANETAAKVWKQGTGKATPSTTTNTTGSSTQGIKYNTADGSPAAKTSDSTTSSSNTYSSDDYTMSTDTVSSEPSMWDKTKETLSKAPTTLGGLVSGLKSIGNVMSALWGSIIGEGSFRDILEGNNSTSELGSGTIFTNSGNYETYTNGEEQKRIWKYFKDKGYSNNAIAGIMGAWQHESSNQALRVEGDYLAKAKSIGVNNILASNASLDDYVKNVLFPAYDNTPSLKGKIKKNAYIYNSHYYPGLGLAQWTGVRAYNLGQYANSTGSDWRSLYTQLNFANQEIEKRSLKSSLNNSSSPEDAAYLFAKKFEVGGYTGSGLTKRQQSARTWYNTLAGADLSGLTNAGTTYRSGMKNANAGITSDSSVSTMTMYGNGPVGFGPDDGPSNWAELMQGSKTVNDYLSQRLVDMGILDSASLSNGTNIDGSSSGVSYDPSMWGSGSSAPVDAMRSIYGQLYYSLDGNRQDPDKGTASCASTVAWAYKKALGIRPGDSVSSGAYMSSTQQAKDNRFTTIWTNTGSGLTDDVIKNVLRPGDIVYQNWKQTANNGNMSHTEMYAGNGKTLSHGGPNYSDKGPVYRDLTSSNRKAHTMMIRRYNGFLKNNTGYGPGPSKDTMKLENEFYKEIQSKNNDHTTRLKQHEGEPTSYGNGTTNNNDNVVTRLDKILTVIGEWYMDSKNKKPETSTTNNTTTNVVNNSSVVKTSTENPQNNNVTTHIDKLAQKHDAYAKMYKTTI